MAEEQSIAQLTDRFYEHNDLSAADELVERLTHLLEDAQDESDVQTLLEHLENIVIDDIVRSSAEATDALPSDPGPSTQTLDNENESLIQATSLTLLPLITQIPAYSADSAQSVIKLVLLVSQRGNPKECLMGIEQALERLLRRLEVQNIDAEDGAMQLSRLLTALNVVLPRIRTKRLHALVRPLSSNIQLLIAQMCKDLTPEDTADLPTLLLISTITQFLMIVTKLAQQQSKYDELQSKLQTLLFLTVEYLVPLLLDLPFLSDPQPETTLPSCVDELITAASLLELDVHNIAGDPPDSRSADYSSARTILLAYFLVSATSANAPHRNPFLLQAPDLLKQSMQCSNPDLAARTLDALLFLTQKGLEAYTDNPLHELVLEDIVDSLVTHFDKAPPRFSRAVISVIAMIIQETLANRPDSQDRLIKLLLSQNDRPHIKSVALSVLRNLLLAAFFETGNGQDGQHFRFTNLMQVYRVSLFTYEPVENFDSFLENKLQTYFVSLLNLLYLIMIRDSKARQTDIWDTANLQIMKDQLLQPLRSDVNRLIALAVSKDSTKVLSLQLLEDTLSKVETLAETAGRPASDEDR